MTSLRQRFPVALDSSTLPEASSGSESDDSANESDESSLPTFSPPNFTLKELLGAIPAHCFERSALKSSQYIVQDVLLVAGWMVLAAQIDGNLGWNGQFLSGGVGEVTKWAAWCLYWFGAGLSMTGLWVIAHECGHQAFSPSKRINNAVGFVLHSLLLVPYHSWRISHARHHASTGHMTRDEVFVPKTRSQVVKPVGQRKIVKKSKSAAEGVLVEMEELLEDAPIYRLAHLLFQQLLGWPAYLFFNVSGQSSYPRWTNHFDPASLIFDARHRNQVLASDAGLLVVAGLLYAIGDRFGWTTLWKFYGVPYLAVNHWLVMITYLQHSNERLPHYRAGEWNFQRGALCTIDREWMGFVGPFLLHGIKWHVVHHTVSRVAHYHGKEATEALKAKLGSHYISTDENCFVSLWKTMGSCKFVDDEGEVIFYRDAYGRAARRVEYEPVASDSGIDVAPLKE